MPDYSQVDDTQPAFLAAIFALSASAPATKPVPIEIGLPTNRYDSLAAAAPVSADEIMIGLAIRPPIIAPLAANFNGMRPASAMGREGRKREGEISEMYYRRQSREGNLDILIEVQRDQRTCNFSGRQNGRSSHFGGHDGGQCVT